MSTWLDLKHLQLINSGASAAVYSIFKSEPTRAQLKSNYHMVGKPMR